MVNLNKSKIKVFKDYLEEYLQNLRIWKDFLNRTQKALVMKSNDKMDNIKLKTSDPQRHHSG